MGTNETIFVMLFFCLAGSSDNVLWEEEEENLHDNLKTPSVFKNDIAVKKKNLHKRIQRGLPAHIAGGHVDGWE